MLIRCCVFIKTISFRLVVDSVQGSRVMGQHWAGMDDRMGDRMVDIGMDQRGGDQLGRRVHHMTVNNRNRDKCWV